MVNLLKEKIVVKFGHFIRNRGDCEQLSEQIEMTTGETLSYNTLRRFFNIDNKSVKPSTQTLDVLSRYIGYRSYSQFAAARPHQHYFDNRLSHIEIVHSFDQNKIVAYYNNLPESGVQKMDFLIELIRLNLVIDNLSHLCEILDVLDISASTIPYEQVLIIGNSVGLIFRKLNFRRASWKLLGANKGLNHLVFNVFVDYSSLNGYYAKVLSVPAINQEQSVLRYCLGKLRDFLNLKPIKFNNRLKYFQSIVGSQPILEGRLLSLGLYGQAPVEPLFNNIKYLNAQHLYEPMVASILSSNFELFIFIERNISNLLDMNSYQHIHYTQVLLLFKSCFHYKNQRASKARTFLKEVNQEAFRLSYKEILIFFYYLLDYKLNNCDNARNEAIGLAQKLNYPRYSISFIDRY